MENPCAPIIYKNTSDLTKIGIEKKKKITYPLFANLASLTLSFVIACEIGALELVGFHVVMCVIS